MSVSTASQLSSPKDLLHFINGLTRARELTSLSEASRTWDALELVTGPSAPTSDELPALITELHGVLHTLDSCAPRLLAIHRQAVEPGAAEEEAMAEALSRARRLLSSPTAARTDLGYVRLLAAAAGAIFDLAGDAP
ncbi:hypothetical protein [Streptomyces sp. NBC_00503]|uniref:hypothetical protein n=1 Tax=Streptomyces sp. NBC_00503 TaxID=2903659 RepID=UPI002E8139FF|nr:hypothetical protein [Streptomyces sp. NBC_00503]WUD85674.1 hypothetical protein OG490_36820 [Streptomyces sp. NBC_00503]